MRAIDGRDIAAALHSSEIDSDWLAAERTIALAGLSGSATVNAGDRRALFYLIRWLKPRRVLEIGTNVGGSTLAVALALRFHIDAGAPTCSLTTIDKRDVNAAFAGAPRHHIAVIGMAERVSFITADSAIYLEATRERFDLVFIDGSHAEDAAYRDVVLSLGRLNPGGLIVLHDYFPNSAPLWSNGKVIPGPYLAVERLRNARPDIAALALGELPWPTKLGSNVTSLAVLACRRS